MEGKQQDHHNDDEKEKNTSKLGPIPLDLEVEILTRLPGKSLWKFRCVSKIWSSIIRSQRFTDSLFAMSSQQSRLIIALSTDVRMRPEQRRVFFFSSPSSLSSSLVANLDFTIPSEDFRSFSAGPCASVHGFLGVNVRDKFIICNPSTTQVIKLPSNNNFLVYDPTDDQHRVISVHVNDIHDVDHYLKVSTLGGGGESGITIPSSRPLSVGIFINGFLYYGASNGINDAVIVCFDVSSEKYSLIKAPKDVLYEGDESILIEYKGKLASIVKNPYAVFYSFDLWVLEDAEKHEWSKQTCEIHCYPHLFSLKEIPLGRSWKISFGSNEAGEIIMAPKFLSYGPFYIYYYNVETKITRRVLIEGTDDIRNRYGYARNDNCQVAIIPQHVERIRIL